MTPTRPPDGRAPLDHTPDAVNAETRAPALAFLGSAVAWLLVGTLLAVIASVKLHAPGFLGATGWLTFGRVRPAHAGVMTYGWASMAGAGVLVWLTARLSRAAPRFPRLLIAAVVLWNLAVVAGAVGVLAGWRTGVPWLEFPAHATGLLAVSLVLVGVSVAVTLLDRRGPPDVPGWYVFAAVFGFPWLYTTAGLLTVVRPVGGVAQAVIASWYADGLLGLWFAPIGLAVLYALIPGRLGRPVASRRLALLGFWSLVVLSVWAGGRRLTGGPVPAWVVTVAIIAGVLLLVHVAAVAINLLPVLAARPRPPHPDPALGFLAFAAFAYVIAGALGALGSLRSVGRLTHFTHAEDALTHLGLAGFLSMALFGAVYSILPGLTGRGWSSPRAIRAHFWCSGGGVLLYWALLTAGGVVQGLALNDPRLPFAAVVRRTLPFLWGRTAAGVVMSLGHLIFAALLVLHLARRPAGRARHDTGSDRVAPGVAGGDEAAAVAGPREGGR